MGLEYREQVSRIMLFLFFLFIASTISHMISWIEVKQKELEIAYLRNLNDTANNRYNTVYGEAEEIRIKYNQSLADIQNLLEQVENYEKQKADFMKTYNILNSRISEYEIDLGQLRGKITLMEEELKEKERQIISLKQNLDKSRQESNAKVNRKVYLTFDDGPSVNTEKILDILKRYNIKATFFVIGKPNLSHLYKRIADEGHIIGNHSYTHNFEYLYSSPANFRKDIERLEKLVFESTGVYPAVFRFPGGSNNYMLYKKDGKKIFEECISIVNEKGYAYFDWNVDSKDALKITQKKDVIIDSVLNNMPKKGDAIILFHDGPSKTTTIEALPEIIEELQKRGYKFDVLTDNAIPVHFFK